MSGFHALLAALVGILPGRGALHGVIRLYTRRMLWAMRVLAGIRVDLRGKDRLPAGAFIIAAKHHSWGDGFDVSKDAPMEPTPE